MLEPRSPLAAVYAPGLIGSQEKPPGLAVRERRRATLVQLSGWPDGFDSLCDRLEAILGGPMPADGSRAVALGERTVFRVGPERLWVVGSATDGQLAMLFRDLPRDQCVVTDIAHSRTVLCIAGAAAPEMLNRGLPIDLDGRVFPPGAVAQSVVHHVPILVHRLGVEGEATFDVYVPRDYAVSFWHWLIAVAAPFGCRIGEPVG